MVTPFTKDGEIDREGIKSLVEFHIANGTDGLVPCGCTGEAATLSHDEQEGVIELVVETVAGRISVLAGTGSNNTKEAIRLTKFADKVGADGAMLITPYYNKPTSEGLYRHYSTVAEGVDIPIVMYNVPSRTGISMAPEVVAKLVEDVDNIVGIKEASGSLSQISQILNICGDKIILMSGDDSLTLPIMAVGGKGVVSVAANIAPRDVADMTAAYLKGDLEKARQLHHKLFSLFKVLFIETNPMPVKAAMNIMGLPAGEPRLPLTPLLESNIPKLKKVMEGCGLLK